LRDPSRTRHHATMIIDCHVHPNDYHEELHASLDESLDKLQAAMQLRELADFLDAGRSCTIWPRSSTCPS
jgi:hypothetical protein